MFSNSTNKLIFLILLTFSSACQQKSRFHISTFENPVEVKINRFDLDFVQLDTTEIILCLTKLEQQYPEFYSTYITEGLMMNPADTVENASLITNFLADTGFIKVHQKVTETFSETKDIENQLTVAFNYLGHYFQDIQLPDIYFFVSGFNHQFIMRDNILGVGTDMYLGADYPVYRGVTHDYLIRNMRREMLVSDLLNKLLHNRFAFNHDINLLNVMLYEGKISYLLSIILPDAEPEIIIGYSKEELSWSQKQEKRIWTNMIENKHLFSTDYILINQYINLAPFTTPVSQESPGRLGVWMGWQIVKSYMQNNKDVTLEDLMNDFNYQSILEKSLYRP
ncbi:MAG: hypothetical protein Q7J05_04900 [Paludibacter sp.]|nr:hypothetical protein [Paludibacter sp.]